MELEKNAGATTLYLILTIVKWIFYIGAGVIAITGIYIEQSISTANNPSSLGVGGWFYFGVPVLGALIVGYLANVWRDSIIKAD